MAVPHWTSAIHVSLEGLGRGPGDEGIVPEITWIASAAPTHHVGATPVFAEVDATLWRMSVKSVRGWITERTKAIIPIGLCGRTPDMEGLRSLASEHGLRVIEHAAQIIGSRRQEQLAGTFGDAGVFSFHGTKKMTRGVFRSCAITAASQTSSATSTTGRSLSSIE